MYQTLKRKRAIADLGGAQAKYLEKVVAPDKSNSPLGVVAISPDNVEDIAYHYRFDQPGIRD